MQEAVLEEAPLFNERQIEVTLLCSLILGQIWLFSLPIITIGQILELHLELLWQQKIEATSIQNLLSVK